MNRLPINALSSMVLVLFACNGPGKEAGETSISPQGTQIDNDGDGYVEDEDCDDNDASINPGAVELCDGLDNDCDGTTDQDDAADASTWYADSDSDGYGDASASTTACSQPSGYVADSTDCDDTAAAVNPGATEYCDGKDNDCDGTTDEDDAADASTWYADSDGDGYGDASASTAACSQPTGYVPDDTDCDDSNAVCHMCLCGDVDLYSADAKLIGESDYDDAGSSVSTAGDVNGDGLDDLLVGAYGEDSGGSNAGAAYLVLSPVSGNVDLSSADAKLIGESSGDSAGGYSVSTAGDANGDGLDDLLVGAYGDDSGGSAAGAAYLVLGPVSGEVDLSSANAKLIGESSGDYAGGYSVSTAGDADGDGLDDLLVGAIYEDSGGSNAGAAYLVLGPVSGEVDLSSADAKLIGESSGDYAGSSVSTAGDANGDGLDDLLVGAYTENSGGSAAGAAYLVLGPVSGEVDLSSADVKLIGESSDDYAGISVSTAGDADGDGLDDLLVGAYYEDSGGTNAGAAYLIYGE